MMLRTFLFAAAAALAASCAGNPASAADFTVTSGFVSRHAGSTEYNERNTGLGLRIDSGSWAGWTAGTYRNSLGRQTWYVAKEWQYQLAAKGAASVSAGLVAGLATGYRFAVIPAVLPELVVRYDVLELALLVQPLDLKQSPAFAALQVRVRF